MPAFSALVNDMIGLTEPQAARLSRERGLIARMKLLSRGFACVFGFDGNYGYASALFFTGVHEWLSSL